MAYSFSVLVQRKALPTNAILTKTLNKVKLPLSFPETWQWQTHSGWLPMVWRKQDSGCEVELEKLSKKAFTAAKAAGYSLVDTDIVITARGEYSLESAVSFAAALAMATNGCIHEGDDEYIPARGALPWAKQSIASAAKSRRTEKKRDQAKEKAAAGNVEEQLEAVLTAMRGTEATLVSRMGRIGMSLPQGIRIVGSVWCLTGRNGTQCQNDRYAAIRSQQLALMASWQGEPTKSQTKKYESLDKQLDKAGAEDEQALAFAEKEMATWPKKLQVVSAEWIRPNGLIVRFDGGLSIQYTGGMLNEIRCVLPTLDYRITEAGVAVS